MHKPINYIVEVDIKKFYDNIQHKWLMRCLRERISDPNLLWLVKQFLKAGVIEAGHYEATTQGAPQGGIVSPIISNIFMHHAFDMWMRQNYPTIPFERYVDDAIVHCKTKRQADFMKAKIEKRLAEYKLKLHPDKTQIVYCKDDNRSGEFPKQSFDFLGYTFRPRLARNKIGKKFVSFLPAISNKAKKKICQVIRSWRIHRQTSTTLEEISKEVNPIVRGWLWQVLQDRDIQTSEEHRAAT